jgi:hypothetical protein
MATWYSRSDRRRLAGPPKTGKIEKTCETLEKLNLTEFNTCIIDPMLNSAYLGTDEDELTIPVAKSVEDVRYHLLGDLQCATSSVHA